MKREVKEMLRALPHPAPEAPKVYPMSPQEALAIGTLFERQRAIQGQLEAIAQQACARLGLAIGTKIEVNPEAGTYTVK